MNDVQILKNKATRQFRHNNDNSPNVFRPEGGFVIAYDRGIIDKVFLVLEEINEMADEWRSVSNSNSIGECTLTGDECTDQLQAMLDKLLRSKS